MCDKRLCACEKKHKASTIPSFLSEDDERVKALETAYAEFAEIDSKSLLKKHLTRPIFDKLKIRVTGKGSTLMDVIQSGLKNPDSHVGMYAPDQAAYDVFGDLFDPMIEDYHSDFKPEHIHPELDWGSAEDLGNLDPEGKYVISTRIRCARSVNGYPFNPTMTSADYQDLEKKVQEALLLLEGELKGSYYTLAAIDKETQQQLIDDHFLFKEGDRYLEAANSNRFWPTGRGIFFNEEKTFLVWCNEEDHMRLISMEKGGDLSSVYARLVKAVTEVGKKLKFARHRRLGYLTFCPTNLGTTIRASVHAQLPKLSADYPRFEEIANMYHLQWALNVLKTTKIFEAAIVSASPYNDNPFHHKFSYYKYSRSFKLTDRVQNSIKAHLQIRGTRGEHTESEGGVYDISNKRRLGLTEREVVYEMRNGILELIKQEKQLEES